MMGFYSRVIFPQLMDWSMSSSPALGEYRQQILSKVSGEVLEIGFGTGLNLPYYPEHIQKLTVIDVNPGMNSLARKRIQTSPISVDIQFLSSESLPMADNSFDSIISTWTLCSIANVDQALQEIYRVLKPGGKFFFIEHGLSEEPQVQVWQNRLNTLQKIIADGCHLNRNIKQLIDSHFQILQLEQFYAPDMPKTHSYMYQGVATKTLLSP